MYDEAELSNMIGEYVLSTTVARSIAHRPCLRNYDSLKQVTPDNALFYRFHSRSRDNVPSEPNQLLGTGAALADLQDAECELATQEWVNNHWSLILWKLAGMVCLQPQLEADPATRRWCWDEVINQLLYRYLFTPRLLTSTDSAPQVRARAQLGQPAPNATHHDA